MKKMILMIGILASTSGFAGNLDINVSAQGADTCLTAVKLFAELVAGRQNPSIKIEAKRLMMGACDGDSCNPNSQDFIVKFVIRNSPGTLEISTVGPDSADRCQITTRL